MVLESRATRQKTIQREAEALRWTKLVFLLISIYAVADVATSASSGVTEGRSAVHILMLLTTAVLIVGLMQLSLNRPIGIAVRIAPASFVLMPVWIALADMNAGLWGMSASRIFITIWWVALFSFARAVTWRVSNARWLSLAIMALLAIYVGGMLWGINQIELNFSVDAAVSNYGYFVIAMYPIIRLIPNRVLNKTGRVIILLAVMVSLKRGAIIIALVFVLYEVLFAEKSKRATRLISVTALVVAGIAFLLPSGILQELQRRFAIEELISGSGRSDIYDTLFKEVSGRSSGELLFGTGSGSVGNYTSVAAAHNDFLEMQIAYGLVGVVLLGAWLCSCIRVSIQALRAKDIPRDVKMTSLMAVTYVVIVGLYGQGIFGHATLFSVVLLGSIAGLIDRRKSDIVS